MNKASFVVISLIFVPVVLLGCMQRGWGSAESVDGVKIQYEIHGSGEPALILVHGWCCDRGYWRHQVSHLSKTRRVVAVDLAGHGESGVERERYTIEAFGRDVAAAVEELDLNEVILVGHSLGGPVNLEAARLLGDKVIGIIGVDTYQNFGQKVPEAQAKAMTAAFDNDFAATMRQFVQSMFVPGTDSAFVNEIVNDMSSAPAEIGLSAFVGYLGHDPAPALRDIDVPIVAINSDLFPTNAEMGRRMAGSFEVKLIPGCGHFLHLEIPDEFNDVLESTIAGMTRAKR